MRRILILTAAIGLGAALLSSGLVSADGHVSTVSGTLAGDRGGAHASWDVNLPADTDATLTLAFWPCGVPSALELEVWGANGMLGKARQSGGCEKSLSWNTGDGGPATIRYSNYLHGVPTHYAVGAEGFSLPGGVAPVAPAAPMADDTAADDTAMADDAAADATMADTTAADTTTAAAGTETMAADTAAAAPVVGAGAAAGGTLLGNSGGAFATHDMPVTAGTTYTLEMSRGLDVGGNWPAVGFHVWGPNGLVASSKATHDSPASATFTAAMDGTYTVQMYNYHHGHTMFYALHHVTEGM